MHNKRNVVVMFLLIMLSFAIITEVSAHGDAEIDGTKSDQSMMSVDMPKHVDAGERFNENMQNHVDADDFQSHNEQKSFNKTPADSGDNKRNENLYEHGMDVMPNCNATGFEKPECDGKQLDNFTRDMNPFEMPNPDAKFNQPKDLRDNKSSNIQNGELMDEVVSKLIGMNNISPNFKNNNSLPLKNKNDMNKSAPKDFADKNSSNMHKDSIKKDSKAVKKSKKAPKKVKKTSKKVKSKKKPKKTNKKSNKERAKL